MPWISKRELDRIYSLISQNHESWRTMKFKQNDMQISLTAQKNRIRRMVEKIQRLRQELRKSKSVALTEELNKPTPTTETR